jgi:hypothetical protein
VPAYLLIAWRLDRYQAFIWLPFAAQLVFAIAVAYAIVAGDTDFGDGILVVAVSAIFAGALGFVWITEQRTVAISKLDDDSEDAFVEDA